jgi:hypothetical protein
MAIFVRIITAIGFLTCEVLLVVEGATVLAEVAIASFAYGTLTGVAAAWMAPWILRPPQRSSGAVVGLGKRLRPRRGANRPRPR